MRVQNLFAGYDGGAVVRGVSIELAPRDFVGIIGPNGSGKTTLLRSMSRSLKPLSGTVELEGQNAYALSAREFARRVAVVPQDTAVVFDFTVLETVLMGRSPHLGRFSVESARDVGIACEALRLTGVFYLRDRSINALSGGERQRVMIARAIAQEPRVLLLDEPTSHLDISFQFEVMDLLRSLNRDRGITILVILHDLNLASQYCDRLYLMGAGEIQVAGTPEEVVTADNIRRVYGAEVWVRKNPVTQRPYVIAGVRRRIIKESDELVRQLWVHIVGGGGTAAPVVARLVRRGYKVTCGVLNEGDADCEVADALDVPCIVIPAFTYVTPEVDQEHRKLINCADLVILSEVPVGHGNLANVQAVRDAAVAGKKVFILKPYAMKDRDFTGGVAARLVDEALHAGAEAVDTAEGLLRTIESFAGSRE
ncbi:MAG: ABC transporter ATP-binding protein [Armatimonadota bacterium]